jgi:hypothetical protein
MKYVSQLEEVTADVTQGQGDRMYNERRWRQHACSTVTVRKKRCWTENVEAGTGNKLPNPSRQEEGEKGHGRLFQYRSETCEGQHGVRVTVSRDLTLTFLLHFSFTHFPAPPPPLHPSPFLSVSRLFVGKWRHFSFELQWTQKSFKLSVGFFFFFVWHCYCFVSTTWVFHTLHLVTQLLHFPSIYNINSRVNKMRSQRKSNPNQKNG